MPIPAPSSPGPGFSYGEQVTRLRASAVIDPYSGDPAPDWATPTEVTFDRCAVWQETSTEPLEVGRSEVVTTTKVAFPADADVLAGDRLTIRGEVYDVLGDPFDWRSPFTGWAPGRVAAARKVDG